MEPLGETFSMLFWLTDFFQKLNKNHGSLSQVKKKKSPMPTHPSYTIFYTISGELPDSPKPLAKLFCQTENQDT